MQKLIHPKDKYQMNWIEGTTEWGTVKSDIKLTVNKNNIKKDDVIIETYTFINETDYDIFTLLTDISIYTPFNDNYENAEVCMTNKCHAHIWCGDDITYVMALRMGGESPHLGMVLTKGGIGGYSIERDLKQKSNDRGDFILHPCPASLAPGECLTIEWILFWHEGKDDFYCKLKQLNPRFIDVRADDFIVFQGERIKITANSEIVADEIAEQVGERTYQININNVKTKCDILVLPKLDYLIKARCNYIATKQQYHKENSPLDGAYLIYDTEDKHIYYNPKNDVNAGRERVGMGVLMARYLQNTKDEFLNNSLLKYIKFIKRELLDEETGEVYNDCKRNNDWLRLYNFPWMSTLFIELYILYDSVDLLKIAYKIMKFYYSNGGDKFYAIDIPIVNIIDCLAKEKLFEEKNDLIKHFKLHSDNVIETGTNYPLSEVNYEQSIVAPAVNLLIQTYVITDDEKYLNGAKQHMAVLELFNGQQPDYHLYEVAIRHWDGYWFGKKRLYGDTFPHYWSSLTGNAYHDFFKILKDETYIKKARASLRSSLSLFKPDGSASCAYVLPVMINGIYARYYDPYANDQDWGLYFMLKYTT